MAPKRASYNEEKGENMKNLSRQYDENTKHPPPSTQSGLRTGTAKQKSQNANEKVGRPVGW